MVRIREAHTGEYPFLAELIVRAYFVGPGVSEQYRPILADVGGRAVHCPILVAADETDRPVGTATYVPGPGLPESEFDDADAVGMRMLAVEPARWGEGIGRVLTGACVDRARAAGRRRMVVHVRPEMAVARRLYESMGFRRAPERDWEWREEVPLLGYTLDIEN
jgi:GNAT superfamily N-acetyltransferase